MPKKNLALPRRNSESYVLGYRLPEFHPDGKSVYVDFYAYDPARGEMRRKKIHLDKYKSKREQKLHAKEIIQSITSKLRSGWNPWCSPEISRGFINFTEVVERYLDNVKKTVRLKTIHSYNSKAKIMLEYNQSRFRPIIYAYEYDSAFINDFLDWILLDRDVGPNE